MPAFDVVGDADPPCITNRAGVDAERGAGTAGPEVVRRQSELGRERGVNRGRTVRAERPGTDQGVELADDIGGYHRRSSGYDRETGCGAFGGDAAPTPRRARGVG